MIIQYLVISIPKPGKSRCGDASFADQVQIGSNQVDIVCLADGVSTCDSDHLASKTAVEIIQESIRNKKSSVQQTLVEAIQQANEALCQ